MFKAFVTLFIEADWVFFVLFFLAIGLFVLELFIPNFSIAGFAGIILTLGAITERCTAGENTSNQIIFYIVYITLLTFLSVIIAKSIVVMVRRKKNRIKFAMVDGNKVPLTKEGNLDYSFIIGEEGEVLTDLKPTGKVRFESGTFEATSTKEYIYAGTWVKADRIFNGRIIVNKK